MLYEWLLLLLLLLLSLFIIIRNGEIYYLGPLLSISTRRNTQTSLDSPNINAILSERTDQKRSSQTGLGADSENDVKNARQ